MEGAVGKKAVIAHGYPQAAGDPVENQEGENRRQALEAGQKSQCGQAVQQDHEAHHAPAPFEAVGWASDNRMGHHEN